MITLFRHLAISLLFGVIPSLMFAQYEECGTPDFPPEQLQSLISQFPEPIPAALSNSSRKISVWFYHLRASDGTSNFFGVDPAQTISTINGYFDGLFEFVYCGTTEIDDDRFVVMDFNPDSTDQQDLRDYLTALNNAVSESSIRIFLCDTNIVGDIRPMGYSLNPYEYGNKAGVYVTTIEAEVWGHELGHYFLLPHTFANRSTQFVNLPVVINGDTLTCLETGDNFCDTPADYGAFCTPSQDCQTASCAINDPLGVPYNPDPTLLMGYYWGCQYQFTPEQRQAMLRVYIYVDDFEPIRDEPLACLFPKFGKIERNCLDITDQNPIEPMIHVPVAVSDTYTICTPSSNITDTSGQYITEPCPFTGILRRVIPDENYLNESLNGVSTYDLSLISRHILGLDTFASPFQYIAADANYSGGITSFDILLLRRLILGIADTIPAGSWRYIPKLCLTNSSFHNTFYDENPFDAQWNDPFLNTTRYYLTQSGDVPNIDSWMDFVALQIIPSPPIAYNPNSWSFVGIKVGDINCNVKIDGNFVAEPGNDVFLVDTTLSNQLEKNTTKTIQVWASGPSSEVVAWQFGAGYSNDTLGIVAVLPGNTDTDFDTENFHFTPDTAGASEGFFRALWYSPDGEPISLQNKMLCELVVRAHEPIDAIQESFRLNTAKPIFRFYDRYGAELPFSLLLRVQDTLPAERLINRPPAVRFSVQATPSVFREGVRFNLTLPMDETVQLALFDTWGRQVLAQTRLFSAGVHEWLVDDVTALPPGAYYYVVRTQTRQAHGKLIKH